jgi:hypothetical protein
MSAPPVPLADQLRQLYEFGKKETDGLSFDGAIRHARKRLEQIDAEHPDDDTFSFAYHAGHDL